MDPDFEKLIHSAITAVFPTMLNYDVTFEAMEGRFCPGEMLVVGSVGFTGSFTGMVYLFSTANFARVITCAMLSMKDDEIEGNAMVNDVMGELTHMVSGHIKTRLDNQGSGCVMTVPAVLRGSDMSISKVSGTIRQSVFCRCGTGVIFVEVLFKSQG